VPGHVFEIALAKGTARVPAKTIVAAGRDVWEWFWFEVRQRASTPFGKTVLEYVAGYTGSLARWANAEGTWPAIKRVDDRIRLEVKDYGLWPNQAMASLHALSLFAHREPEVIETVLERHGLSCATKQPNHADRRRRFFWFDGAIASVEDGLVTRDARSGNDKRRVWKRAELSAADREAVNAFVRSKRCECPACDRSV
jgi:hypothetical protein